MNRPTPALIRWVAAIAVAGAAACSDATGPATAPALVPASVVATTGASGMPAGGQPAVRAVGADGRPVAGVPVTFLAGAGGSVSRPSALTDSFGFAWTDWTLGEAGENTLVATAEGFTPATFTVTARRSCDERVAITSESSTSGSLDNTDCQLVAQGGWRVDKYELTTRANEPISISVIGLTNAFVAFGGPDNSLWWIGEPMQLIATEGSRTISVMQSLSAPGGAYTLSVEAWDGSADNCLVVLLEPGVTTEQRLTPTDCTDLARRNDQFAVGLSRGDRIRVNLMSDEIDTHLEIWGWAYDAEYEEFYLERLLSNDNSSPGSTDSELILTAPASDSYYIRARSRNGELGTYTLSVVRLD